MLQWLFYKLDLIKIELKQKITTISVWNPDALDSLLHFCKVNLASLAFHLVHDQNINVIILKTVKSLAKDTNNISLNIKWQKDEYVDYLKWVDIEWIKTYKVETYLFLNNYDIVMSVFKF